MFKFIASLTFVALSGACNGSSTGNPLSEEHDVVLGSYTSKSFRVESTGSPNCENDTEDSADKFEPSLSAIEEAVGEDAAEFIVMMTTEVSQEDYPFSDGDRDVTEQALEDDEEYLARAQAIADTQVCAIQDVEQLGGSYLQSFVLINAFVAELTTQQAEQLAQRTDVQILELSQSSDAPPL